MMNAGRPPDFICIGAAKAGTTWLYDILSNSPGYWMPPMKELSYFGHPKRNPKLLGRITSLDHITNPKKREWVAYFLKGEPRDDNWYLTLFKPARKRAAGDISPPYSRIGLNGIEHAKRLAPHAKIIMFVRKPADRDLSHLIHIATGNVLGTSKLGAVMDAIAKCLQLTGDVKEQRKTVRNRFRLKRVSSRDMDHLLAILSRLVGRPVSFDDVPEILEKRITVADVRAAREALAFKEQRKQSGALTRWGSVFGKNLSVFFYDDLIADPGGLLARITGFIGRESRPADPSILHRISNRNIYEIEGLEDLRAELIRECAPEEEALRAILGDTLPWEARATPTLKAQNEAAL